MNDLFLIFYSDGVMKADEMTQCQKEKWISIAVFHENDKIQVPCFCDFKVVRQFIRRNFPDNWLYGIIAVTQAEIDWMRNQGWDLLLYRYPNLVKDRKEFGYEILEFQSIPDLMVKR